MYKTLAIHKIVAVAVAFAMIFGVTFAVSASKAHALTEDQISAILSLLSSFGVDSTTYANVEASLRGQATPGAGSGTGTSTGVGLCGVTFTQSHSQGDSGGDIMNIQKFLNSDPDTQIASAPDAGAPGYETSYFGSRTKAAVIKFQDKYTAEVLAPVGLSKGTGYWGASSRAKANAINAGSCGSTGDGGDTTTPTPTGTGVTVSKPTQPANSLAPESAARLPFTNVTVTAGNDGDVVINGFVVERTGLAADAAFAGVVVLDESGNQLGIAKTFNSNHQATVGEDVTVKAGTSKTFTIAGNMAADNSTRAGQVASIDVVGVNTSATVSGSLPITGAGHTINASLTIGTATTNRGVDDPNSQDTAMEIGTKKHKFQSIRVTAGSAEDIRVRSIRWNQSGSASKDDLANVVVNVDGTEYPTVVSADGKYYTATFGSGVVIKKGLNAEIGISADIVSGSNRTVIFDIYKNTDLYITGETFGYGITGSAGSTATAAAATSQFTTGTPWFDGTTNTISAGSVTSVSRANSIPAQNIGINVPNQPLGGFEVNILGEPISVQQMVFYVMATGNEASDIDNITLVDQNGTVLAGPVDATDTTDPEGKITFTDTVTFPTGVTTLTLKGQLTTDFADGDTIVASTTPSTDWTNITGQSTGDTVSLSALSTAVSGNTMTVKGATTTITVNSTPASQTVVAGTSGFTFANFQLDASGSGEDVKISSLKLRYTETGAGTDLNNCFLYDGSTQLNSSAVDPSTTATGYTFTLNAVSGGLLVPKGTIKSVALKCDIPGSATANDTFAWGIHESDTMQGVGLGSGSTIELSVAANTNSGTMTVAANGSFTVALDPSSPSYTQAAAGTSDVVVSYLKFTGSNEDITLTRLGLQLTSATASSSASDLTKVTLWDGATKVGEAIFTGTNTVATSTLSGTFVIPKDDSKILTVKADLSPIGTGKAGQAGALIQIDYDGDRTYATAGTGNGSGASITSGSSADTATAGVRMQRSYPTIAKLSLPSNTLANGERPLLRFSVTANSAGPIGIHKFTLVFSTTTANLTQANIYAYTDSGFSNIVSGLASDGGMESSAVTFGGGGETAWATAASQIPFYANTSAGASTTIQVPAGGTRYFEVRGTVANSASGASVSTQLEGDAAYPGGNTFNTLMASLHSDTVHALANDTHNDFIWSPNSTTTAGMNDNDWTNGYGIPGLPGSNMTAEVVSQ